MANEYSVNDIMNDPFINHILSEKENRMPHEEIQKWADRCKKEIKLSKPRHDGLDIVGWADECEAWLIDTTKAENVKFGTMDIPIFLDMLYDWLNEQYNKLN